MIERALKNGIESQFFKGKAIVLIGPRQVGKTTLIKYILSGKAKIQFLDGDDPEVRRILSKPNTEQLRSIIGSSEVVFIDEVQLIENIGRTLKIITDQFHDVQLIASGSSAFDIRNKLQEQLTGRKRTYHIYPISWGEWETHVGYLQAQQQLPNRLIYGMYPDVLNNIGDERGVLKELTESYLYKDILALGGLRKPALLKQLVQALALQIGHEVSLNQLASLLQVSKDTISAYIDLLEKTFVIFKLESYSRNLRNEIQKGKKIYFWDTGVRNALIHNFESLELRGDK